MPLLYDQFLNLLKKYYYIASSYYRTSFEESYPDNCVMSWWNKAPGLDEAYNVYKGIYLFLNQFMCSLNPFKITYLLQLFPCNFSCNNFINICYR